MEEVNGVNEVNVDFIPSNEEAGFGISPDEVKLMIGLGHALHNTTSPFARMPIEVITKIAGHFCAAQYSWRALHRCVTPPPDTPASTPPGVKRINVLMQGGAAHQNVQRTLFGQVPNP